MRKLKGIIINGEYLGNKVAYNGLFKTICNISPIIMTEFIKLVSQYGTLYSPLEIKGFDLPEPFRIVIKFENKKCRGYADLSFVIQNYRLTLSASDVYVDPILKGRKISEPEPEHEPEPEPVIEKIVEPVVEEIVEPEPAPEPEPEPVAEEVIEPEPEPELEPVPEKIVIDLPETVETLPEELLSNVSVEEETMQEEVVVEEEVENEPEPENTTEIKIEAPVEEVVESEPEPANTEEAKEEPKEEAAESESEPENAEEAKEETTDVPNDDSEQNHSEPPQNDEAEAEIAQAEESEPRDTEPETLSEPSIEGTDDVSFGGEDFDAQNMGGDAGTFGDEPFVSQDFDAENSAGEETFGEETFGAQEPEPETSFESKIAEQPEIDSKIAPEPFIEDTEMTATSTEEFNEAAIDEPKLAEQKMIDEISESKEEPAEKPVREPEVPKNQEEPAKNTDKPEQYKKIELNSGDMQNNLQGILEDIISKDVTPEIVVKKVKKERVKRKKPVPPKKQAPKSPLKKYLKDMDVVSSVEKRAPQFRILQNGKRMDVQVIDEHSFLVGETIYRWGDILYLED